MPVSGNYAFHLENPFEILSTLQSNGENHFKTTSDSKDYEELDNEKKPANSKTNVSNKNLNSVQTVQKAAKTQPIQTKAK